MKITTYQQAVNPNVINAPAVQASQNINAYGTKGDGYNDMTAGIGQVNKVLAQKQTDEDAADVVNARNKIMTSLTDQLYGDDGLLTTGVGANAKGLTDRVTDVIKKTADNVAQQQNQRVAYALRQNISENLQNFQRIAASQEKDQKQSYDKASYDSALSNNNQLAALNYDKPQFLQAQINQNMLLMGARAKTQGWDGQILETNRNSMITNLASGAAMAAIDNKDYDTANKILTTYKSSMDQGTYGKLMSAVKQKQEVKEMDLQTRDILSQVTRPDGSIDITKAHELIDNINGPNAVRTMQGINNKDVFYAAVGSQESGGNYNAQAERTGAFGKYQIMPGNWESWKTQTANAGIDVGSGDISDPQAQEAVAKFKLGQFFDKYGAEGALVAWYAGEQNGERWVEGAPDAIGENGHYSWDAKQGNGDEPSVREYVQQALGKLGSNQSKSAYDPESNQKMKNIFDAMAADQMRARAQQKKDYEDSISQAMQNAGSYSGAINYLESLGDSVDMETSNRLKASAATFYGVNKNTGTTRGTRTSKSYSPDNDQKTLEVNNLKLQMGKTLTAEEIVNGNNASARLIANGYDSGGADLSSDKVMSSITDMLDNGSSKSDIHDALVASGASEETANYYVSLIDKSYDE